MIHIHMNLEGMSQFINDRFTNGQFWTHRQLRNHVNLLGYKGTPLLSDNFGRTNHSLISGSDCMMIHESKTKVAL